MWYRAAVSVVILVSLLVPLPASDRDDRLIVHGWGTFTTLQNDAGQDLFGINIDEEPVPDFVHNLEPFLLNTPVLAHDYWLPRQKRAPRSHPQPHGNDAEWGAG